MKNIISIVQFDSKENSPKPKKQKRKNHVPNSSFSALKSAAFQSTTVNRNRTMSENLLNNQSRDRTQSLFDILINTSRNDTENSSYMQQQHAPASVENNTESSAITSSLIENLLTEYLISLPTSLEEFYKIMGEIYVGEILKQCPQINSPVELMKETLLGRFNNSEGTNNRSFLNTMIRHILQSNLQTINSNPLESQVMRNMMCREQNTPQVPQFVKSNSTPELRAAHNPVISSLMQDNPLIEM